ncbi:archaellar assembly protein FlaJ [Methanosarcina sp. 1.H.A.2.2]|uniref:archaellar assembly protein FlaJ n=1 Tax=Methanosarcina sp. 1.H.A.2.2 TaxID=1483601 RepID=UPI00062247C8|nr:archaellar assembly protein FlaJ [Methanosarcina sp. 1.H.A.2.2]KKH45837.1 flagellar assembly protein FlaJ [Methanosarcina sp. 1.H.A.2.2]
MREEKKNSYDLLFLLTYMASISTTDIERDRIFRYTSEQKGYPISIYFRQVYVLASKWGYEYSRACKYVSKKVKDEGLSDLLGRMATALASGEPEKEFLKNEMKVGGEIFSNQYERNIEELKTWTDGYTALLISTTLVVTIILISSMIYPMGNLRIMCFMVLLLLSAICGIGIFALYCSAPCEEKTHRLKHKSKEQKKSEFLARILLPAGGVITVLLFVKGVEIGYLFLTLAVFMLPSGIYALINDRNIDKRDANFPVFIKTLGSLAGTMGITTSSAMKKLDKETVGFLEPLVEKLYVSLSLDLKPVFCWESFIGESGSELINRSSRIFNDAIDLGGNPADVGQIVSSSSLAIVLLRMKRKLIGTGFTGMIFVLHTVMSGLLVFIFEIINFFSMIMDEMYSSHLLDMADENMGSIGIPMNLFGVGEDIELLHMFTLAAVFILTLSDAIAVKVTDGGGNYKLFFYGAVMFVLSGIVLICVPFVVSKVFIFEI